MISTNPLLREVMKLKSVQELKVTTDNATWAGVIVGLCTAAGGFIGGSRGVAIGGVISSCLTAYHMSGRYLSAVEVINNMSAKEKEKLAELLRKMFRSYNINDLSKLMLKLSTDGLLAQTVVEIIQAFIEGAQSQSQYA